MSLHNSGRTIYCDGPHCCQTTRGVVSLHPTAEQQRECRDWLFTYVEGFWRHYCPRCSPTFLAQHLTKERPVFACQERGDNWDDNPQEADGY